MGSRRGHFSFVHSLCVRAELPVRSDNGPEKEAHILRAREIYAAAVAEALERIQANNNCNRHVLQALAQIPIHTPRQPTSPLPARLTTTATISDYLQRYGRWLNLPLIEGRHWQLTAREARKTFARFAALRDRTGLHALAQQLGHRDRSTTDSGYAGTDYAKRPQFRGARMKDDIKTYARTLVEAGLVLGVCDYGYCVYREEYSACRGNAAGPNPIYREPSTCTRCLNFAVSAPHRPYWLGQVRRCEALLNEPALPTQTLKIVRERLEEARGMLRSIDSLPKENARDRKPAS
jgi:hypothetical protein